MSALDRERIEAFLHGDEISSLTEWCRRRDVPLATWPRQPAARGWLELAIGRAVDRALATGLARSTTAAMQFVCGRFGLDGDSVRRRWERAQQRERGRKTGDKMSLTPRKYAVHCDA